MYALREVHKVVCGNHSSPRSLVGKVIRAGYFWPTMQKDAIEVVQRCDKCQRFRNVQHVLTEHLTSISSPWPFSTQGIDIVGPLPQGKKQVKFLLVSINYFTKWVEAKPLAVITEAKIQKYFQKNIVCRFGILRVIISNNGRQFFSHKFREFCRELGIKNHYSSSRHPQENGQTEVTNCTLLKIIKTRLEGAKDVWVEELLGVLQAYRTTTRTPSGETQFKLAFGTKAVIPVEVGLSSLR